MQERKCGFHLDETVLQQRFPCISVRFPRDPQTSVKSTMMCGVSPIVFHAMASVLHGMQLSFDFMHRFLHSGMGMECGFHHRLPRCPRLDGDCTTSSDHLQKVLHALRVNS